LVGKNNNNERLLCIINPASGKRRWLRLTVLRLEAYAKANDIHLSTFYTHYKGHGTVLTREHAHNKEGVVVLGGDGTLREVVEGMLENPLPLLVIPRGTANVLSKELSLPQDPVKALSLWRTGRIQKIDVGLINKKPFLLMVSAGIDALTVHNVYKAEKRLLGKFAYVLAAMRTITRRKPPRTVLEISDSTKRTLSISGYQIVVSNGKYYAGRMTLNPKASLTSGHLHVMVYKKPGIVAALGMVFNVLSGQTQHLRDLQHYHAQRVIIKTKHRTYLQFDGDRLDQNGGTLEILPRYLPIVVS
jgi:YegS/Rv2252/BmrU family lipid kinase